MLHTIRTNGKLPEDYMPPVVGNGDLILMLDDTGAQHSIVPGITERNPWVRPRIWLSGRRYENRYRDMITYGHIEAVPLSTSRQPLSAQRILWTQTLAPKSGFVETESMNPDFTERTVTFVLLDRNLLVIHKQFSGSDIPAYVRFRYIWHVGDASSDIPPLATWNAEARSGNKPAVAISYQIHGVCLYDGATVLFTDSPGSARANGNVFEIDAAVDPSTHCVTGFLFFADNLDTDWQQRVVETPAWCLSVGYQDLIAKQSSDWADFWQASHIHLPQELSEVQEVWETCLYHCRIGITRWSIGPGFGNGLWAGRYFHDELFPFHALASSNHLNLAGRIPRFRRATLDAAMSRTGGKGTRWGWETTEDGYEGWADLCVSLYEIWHMGSIAQEAWEYYRYTGDLNVLAEVAYPIIKGCAEFYRNWVIVTVGSHVTTVPCMDLDEGIAPVTSGLCTMMAAAYSMRRAAEASDILGIHCPERDEWLRLADMIEASMPVSDETYLPFQGAEQITLAVIATVFPFMIGGCDNKRSAASVRAFYGTCRSSISWTPEPRYNTDWTWTSSWLAASAARLGWADIAAEAIVCATHTTMTFGSVNEHVEHTNGGLKYILPWFTTAAGAFVTGLNELFLQSWSETIRICPAVPSTWRDFDFKLLAAPHTVVEACVTDGRLKLLKLSSPLPGMKARRIALPTRLVAGKFDIIGGSASISSTPNETVFDMSFQDSIELSF